MAENIAKDIVKEEGLDIEKEMEEIKKLPPHERITRLNTLKKRIENLREKEEAAAGELLEKSKAEEEAEKFEELMRRLKIHHQNNINVEDLFTVLKEETETEDKKKEKESVQPGEKEPEELEEIARKAPQPTEEGLEKPYGQVLDEVSSTYQTAASNIYSGLKTIRDKASSGQALTEEEKRRMENYKGFIGEMEKGKGAEYVSEQLKETVTRSEYALKQIENYIKREI